MQCAIVSRFGPIRVVLRQLIESIDPRITLHEASDTDKIESIIQANHPLGLLFMTLPTEAAGGVERAQRIKSNYPDIVSVVLVSYDYPEYGQLSGTMGIDHIISQENIERQLIRQIIREAKAKY